MKSSHQVREFSIEGHWIKCFEYGDPSIPKTIDLDQVQCIYPSVVQLARKPLATVRFHNDEFLIVQSHYDSLRMHVDWWTIRTGIVIPDQPKKMDASESQRWGFR